MTKIVARLTSLLVLLVVSSGCLLVESPTCRLPCQLGIDQNEPLTVQDFVDTLENHGWVQDDPDRTFQPWYSKDAFSSVLETTTIITLDGDSPQLYGSEIKLYIGYVGGISPDYEGVPSEAIENIHVTTTMPLLISWLFYGLPEGGKVLPYTMPGDLNEYNPCPHYSNYIAYHDGGRTIIRAAINRPLLVNLWSAPVEIVYPFESYLTFASSWIGRFERMDHLPCMVGR